MSQSKTRNFLNGMVVGVGLGILLAPKEGIETRSDLKKSFNTLVDTIKDIDIEETKALFVEKALEIKDELAKIDQDTAKKKTEEKISLVEEKCDELIKEAKENDAPVVAKATEAVKKNVTNSLNNVVDNLEKNSRKKKS